MNTSDDEKLSGLTNMQIKKTAGQRQKLFFTWISNVSLFYHLKKKLKIHKDTKAGGKQVKVN